MGQVGWFARARESMKRRCRQSSRLELLAPRVMQQALARRPQQPRGPASRRVRALAMGSLARLTSSELWASRQHICLNIQTKWPGGGARGQAGGEICCLEHPSAIWRPHSVPLLAEQPRSASPDGVCGPRGSFSSAANGRGDKAHVVSRRQVVATWGQRISRTRFTLATSWLGQAL